MPPRFGIILFIDAEGTISPRTKTVLPIGEARVDFDSILKGKTKLPRGFAKAIYFDSAAGARVFDPGKAAIMEAQLAAKEKERAGILQARAEKAATTAKKG